MVRPANFFRTLNGIPVHYDRTPAAPYGSRGIPLDFHATTQFENLLDACFAELEQTCPLGRPEVITSAGAWVNKEGYHGRGEALDLDGIHWSNKIFITRNFPADRHFYIGVEAILRKFFPTVLNFYFNRDHEDHFHIDLGGQLAFNKKRSKVLFLQSALTNVLSIPVAIDGRWGQETAGATTRALADFNLDGQLEELETWKQFLTAVSIRAFQHLAPTETISPTEVPAAELLRNVYSVINTELSGHPARKTIETALTTLANHGELTRLLSHDVRPVDDIQPVGDEGPTAATVTAKRVNVRKKQAGNVKRWLATIDDEPEFVVGKESFFAKQNGRGLSNYSGLKYHPDDYRADYGFWADFIYPTAFCESVEGFFNALNTWDRAHFTFGFMQFAAHVFDGDFAKYFRGLLALPEAAAYFPDLELKNNLVHRKVNGALINLETQSEPTKLARYLNPDFHVVEPVEAENAARLIHWSNNSLASRKLQVEIAIKTIRQILIKRSATYSLDGKPDKVCLVIADVHHHGRGGNNTVSLIKNALATNGDMEKAYLNLLKIGKTDYPSRIKTLKDKIAAMTAEGRLGKMKYSTAQQDFVAAS